MEKKLTPRDHSLFLKAFRTYLQYVNSWLYFRKEHLVGLENVPADGTPVVIVSNHQNCLNDPLCVCLKLTDRRMNFIARANVFNNPLFNKVLRTLGLLPAYRMSHEGYSAIRKNQETFDAVGSALQDGETLMMFPEADHQDKRWLGNFKIGYLRIAFDAAQRFNFEQDVMILPSCNHYSNYFHARTDMMIKFGKPVSLKPYYERYQQEPRETMMEVNPIVRQEIQEMMLHVDDLEHYDQIDFLRETGYGRKYAIENGFKFNYLPSRLLSDQKLVSALQEATKENPEEMEKVYQDTAYFSGELKKLKIRDWLFIKNPGVAKAALRGLGLLLMLPLFIVSIIPTGLLFLIPKVFIKKLIKDHMFDSSFHIGVSVFVSVPICLIIPVVLLWVFAGFWWALGYFIAFPLMFIFVWNYLRLFWKFVGTCIFVSRRNRTKINELRAIRKSIYERLDNMLK
ncbi:MAG: 1-acyl-sn-glycerol-3-phosphate acyltransferase [Rikenellaceae bacterium]|nr:1-acyl-sn-glycerol-3-phosphate acyltransferase [Rikenellaceae bacterium]